MFQKPYYLFLYSGLAFLKFGSLVNFVLIQFNIGIIMPQYTDVNLRLINQELRMV